MNKMTRNPVTNRADLLKSINAIRNDTVAVRKALDEAFNSDDLEAVAAALVKAAEAAEGIARTARHRTLDIAHMVR